MAVRKSQFRRLLLTFEALADFGPVLTGEGDFAQSARTLLASVMDAMAAREAALFSFMPEPAVLRSVAAQGFSSFAEPAIIPLLPKHVQALSALAAPEILGSNPVCAMQFFSSNGNVAPEQFKCIAPLKMQGKLVGVLVLGRRLGDAAYGPDEQDALATMSHYVAVAVHNQAIRQTLEQRATDNVRMIASLHSFYDAALETFAAAIDIKHGSIRGHSLRVGRYAAGIAEALGFPQEEIDGLRAAGYLHDIGKVAVDKALFCKPDKLDPEEFRAMADHTTVGHRIVTGVQFPWPMLPEVVRSHHERADGSGYPDKVRAGELALGTRIVAVADTFDAMITERPYRQSHSVGTALTEIVQNSPTKFDSGAVQGLLIQLRRDACGSNRTPFLDDQVFCTIGASDIDQLAAALNFRTTNGRVYSA